MPELQSFSIPGLATVEIDETEYLEPLLRITLDPSYQGDLNDIERDNPYPDGVYLQCNSTSCINDPALAKFMEVLSHWDHNQDGAYDADAIIDAVEEAMWRSRETPNEFHRPSDGIYTRLLMRLMPPAPKRHIVFSFGELRERFKWQHYVLAIPLILVILGLIQLQIAFLPFMKYSVVSGLMAIFTSLGFNSYVAVGVVVAVLIFVSRIKRRDNQSGSEPSSHSPHTYGFFNKAAVFEEQAFREGAEHWNLGQRVVSCVVFGAIHMVNLIYPLATILPLALGGAIFMVVYMRVYRQTKFRRSAVLSAALVHRVYNRIALIAFGLSLIIILGWGALVMFGIAAILMVATAVSFKQGAPAEQHGLNPLTAE